MKMKVQSIMPYVFILTIFLFGVVARAVYTFKHFNF